MNWTNNACLIIINILTRKVCLCVCLSVTDVTHFRNVYSGNEATTYSRNAYAGNESPNVERSTLVNFIAPKPQLQEGYEGATVDTRASEDCTIDEPDFIAGYQGEAEG